MENFDTTKETAIGEFGECTVRAKIEILEWERTETKDQIKFSGKLNKNATIEIHENTSMRLDPNVTVKGYFYMADQKVAFNYKGKYIKLDTGSCGGFSRNSKTNPAFIDIYAPDPAVSVQQDAEWDDDQNLDALRLEKLLTRDPKPIDLPFDQFDREKLGE